MSYTPTVWKSGDVVSSVKLNKLENGVAAASAGVDELKVTMDKLIQIAPYFPEYVRGTGNFQTGIIGPDPTNMTRICEVEYIPTALFDTVEVKAGLSFYVMYYDADKAYTSTYAGWISQSPYQLDTSKAFARVFLKKEDGSDFVSVPEDALAFVNSQKEYATQPELAAEHSFVTQGLAAERSFVTNINDTLYGMAYSERGSSDAAASYAVRWFINQEFPGGWLHAITLYGSSVEDDVITELWERNGNAFTRYDSKTAHVYAGNNTIEFDVAIRANTWISFAPAASTMFLHNTGIARSSLILRDKVSTSFLESSLEQQPYRIIADVVLYSLPDFDDFVTRHTFTIGENDNVAEVLTEAMRYPNSLVYIEPFEHDCIAEWEDFFGSDYFTSMSSGRGLELENGIHIIGRSGHKLKCWYTGSNDYVMANFSLFNNQINGSGYTLENLCIDTKKIRYCIHDERNADLTPYKVHYLRCIMSQDMTGSTWDRSRACIGGGLGSFGDVIVEDCIFNTVTSEENMDSLAYHNGNGDKCESSIVIKNCYCAGDSTLQLASYGPSTKKTKVIVSSCSFGSEIEVLDWTGGTPNLEIYQINNEIRS